MNDQLLQILMIACGSAAVACAGFFVMKLAMGNDADAKLRDRLNKAPVASEDKPQSSRNFKTTISKIGQAASKPFMPTDGERVTGLRQSLAKAGIYAPSALRVLTGFKLILLIVGLAGGYALGTATGKLFMFLSLGGLIGYLAPQIWLRLRIRSNQGALSIGLPDALDLMVVCVEAGLTVDAAMQRVGTELALAHPALSREFGIAHMETRVGLSRTDSLKNLAVRTGNTAIQSLVAMLVQADRFGTSIAQALRVYADALRTNRQFAAEEQAAKASVKISFPLVLFIFPSTFIVLCGPTILELMNSELMK